MGRKNCYWCGKTITEGEGIWVDNEGSKELVCCKQCELALQKSTRDRELKKKCQEGASSLGQWILKYNGDA